MFSNNNIFNISFSIFFKISNGFWVWKIIFIFKSKKLFLTSGYTKRTIFILIVIWQEKKTNLACFQKSQNKRNYNNNKFINK